MIARLARFANDSYYLLRTPHAAAKKAALWFNLLRPSGKMLGFDIAYFDGPALQLLYREIFARQHYYFRANTDSPVILDCGANIGMATLYFKWLYPKARIEAFEPDPDAFAVLETNIARNHLTDVVAHNCALWDGSKQIEFFVDHSNPGSLLMSADASRLKGEAIQVPSRRLSEFIQGPIDFLKLVYGEQEHSAYNGHFESTCYHPLLLFNGEGDCLGAKLRPGNVHSAEDWEEVLLPEIERQQELGKEVVFRADAAFAKPEIYEAMEDLGVKYAIRLPANDNLLRDIEELLTRPAGRPSHKPIVWYKGFLYQAASWKTARRVVAKVEYHAGELFPRLGFIVTNLETPSRAVVHFYNKRGTAEQWIKEGKQAVKMTRLSCHRFRSNQVRLALSLLAYNLGNLWRRLGLPRGIENWSLTSLQQRLVKTGGRLVKHARYYWLLLAEGHLNRRRFGAMLDRIMLLSVPTG